VNTEVLIRSAVETDHPQWRPLWDGYNAFYGRSDASALPEQITRTIWTRFFDESEPVHALVAELHGRIVGIAHYMFHRSMISIEQVCYMQDLFTASEARGCGVGRALIEAVCERAWAAGSRRVYWHTHETNAAAMRLYNTVAEKSGFVVYRVNMP